MTSPPWDSHPGRWRSVHGGRQWKLTPDGFHVRDPEGSTWIPRTKGRPVSVISLMEDFGDEFIDASRKFGIGVDVLVALACIESAVDRSDRSRRDPRSLLKEPGYKSDRETPNRVSAGLMQTLLTTARSVAHTVGYAKSDIDRDLLFDPGVSIAVSAAYLRDRTFRHGGDPVLMQAAYNAGAVYRSGKNDWRLRTNAGDRTDRFIAYFNDFHAALRDGEFGVPYARLLAVPPEPLDETGTLPLASVTMTGLSEAG